MPELPAPDPAAWLTAFGLDPPSERLPAAPGVHPAAAFRIGGSEYQLTLFPETRIPAFAAELLGWLSARGAPVPSPVPGDSGEPVVRRDSQAAVLTRCPGGAPVPEPEPEHCAALGTALGRIHRLGQAFPREAECAWGMRAWRAAARAWAPRLEAQAAALLEEEVRFQALFRLSDLPRGPLHGAATPAHARFEGSRLSGLTGWWSACSGSLLLDLAICADSWCTDAEGGLDRARLGALVAAYGAERPFTAMERGAWPVALRAAALHAWLGALDGGAPEGETASARRRLARRVGNRERLPA